MNTRIIPVNYNYLAPTTLAEALTVLADKPRVKILAGGTDLIVKLKTGVDIPLEYLMDIKRIEELKLPKYCQRGLFIGPLATLSQLEKDPDLQKHYPALAEALRAMAAVSVRNMATMAGNLCNASPVADTAGPAICYGAQLKLENITNHRIIKAEDFFTGPQTNVMTPQEILTEIFLPQPLANCGGAFRKKTRVKADIAKISATAVLAREGNIITHCRIAMGSIAAVPLFLGELSAGLIGQEMSPDLRREAGRKAAETIKPIDDNRTTAGYRTAIAGLLVEEVLAAAWQRAGGEL
ncbi:MAG: xanthine dehydrogenase family protein subunit M [Clostridiales bacterium]|nr:xanthine dehydrogenase family protein subunit M [Clostridiales bacterium]